MVVGSRLGSSVSTRRQRHLASSRFVRQASHCTAHSFRGISSRECGSGSISTRSSCAILRTWRYASRRGGSLVTSLPDHSQNLFDHADKRNESPASIISYFGCKYLRKKFLNPFTRNPMSSRVLSE